MTFVSLRGWLESSKWTELTGTFGYSLVSWPNAKFFKLICGALHCIADKTNENKIPIPLFFSLPWMNISFISFANEPCRWRFGHLTLRQKEKKTDFYWRQKTVNNDYLEKCFWSNWSFPLLGQDNAIVTIFNTHFKHFVEIQKRMRHDNAADLRLPGCYKK